MAKYKGDVQAYKVRDLSRRLDSEDVLNGYIAELNRQQPQAKALNDRVAQTVSPYFCTIKVWSTDCLQITVSHLYISTEDSSAGLPAHSHS